MAAYATLGSVFAVGFAYVFGPTLFPRDGTTGGSVAPRPSTAIGLSNPANDCFINSVLQALAGLPRLRDYLEAHDARRAEGAPAADADERCADRIVTDALLDMVRVLTQRPAGRKTASSRPFVRALEVAFRSRVSRQQQDAQEFLQLVLERLSDEHAAGSRRPRGVEGDRRQEDVDEEAPPMPPHIKATDAEAAITEAAVADAEAAEAEVADSETSNAEAAGAEAAEPSSGSASAGDAFPFEGKLQSHIQCQRCGFEPKPTGSSFVTLTLNVPDKSSSTLDECLDGLLKVERIDGYRCVRCCLRSAVQRKEREAALARNDDDDARARLEAQIDRLNAALRTNEEDIPGDVDMPGGDLLPQSQISKHITISEFPAILAVHLSRSIFDSSRYSRKNNARLAFPETLHLGGFDRRTYRLMSLITHKGAHSSGHYETFRRQDPARPAGRGPALDKHAKSRPLAAAPADAATHARGAERRRAGQGTSREPSLKGDSDRGKSRWWRISDDSVGRCKTADVLSMQTASYLLFYEQEAS